MLILPLRRVIRVLVVVVSAVAMVCGAAIAPVSAEAVDHRPVMYLTFDDGPSADTITEDLLQVLALYDAKATFFVTGHRTRRSPEKISAILYGGHSIGNHTDNHARLTEASSDEIFYELNTANVAVANAGGPPLTCFRPPFGLTDFVVDSIAEDLGLVPVKWTVDTRDWDPNTTAESIRSQLNSSVDGSVVLLHDGPVRRGKMLQVFEQWMSVYSHRFQFKTLPQCDTYGDLTFAAVEEPTEHHTIEGLLEKLRAYRFTLDQVVGQSREQLTAKLATEISTP